MTTQNKQSQAVTPVKRRQLSPRTHRFFLMLAGLTFLGLVLRLLVGAELAGLAAVNDPSSGTDMATYKAAAIAITEGNWPEYFYYQPFYYAVFLPLIYLLFGTGAWGVMLVQALLGAAVVWLTGIITAHLFGRKEGLVAALLIALARFHIFYTPFLLIAVLQSFWLLLLTWFCLQGWRRNTWWSWLCLGAVTAAGILTRGNILLLVPGILLLLIWRNRRCWRHALAMTALFLITMYVPQLPFAIRNFHYYGRWTGPSTAQDAVLALGNTPEAPPGGLEYPQTYQDWMELADQAGSERIPVSRQVLQWAMAEPLAFLELELRKFLLFWHRQEIPNNIAFSREGRQSVVLQFPLLLGFGVLGTLGLAGMLLSWKRRSPLRLYLYFEVLIYCAATVLFYILARFRLPMVPLLCVFAGGFVHRVLLLWKRRKKAAFRAQFLLVVLALTISSFFVFQAMPLYQETVGKAVLRWVRPHGMVSRTHRRLLVYDYGPRSSGGWNLLPIPTSGLSLTKEFQLPDDWLSDARLSQPTLRLALQGATNSRLRLLVVDSSGRRQEKIVLLQGRQPLFWVEVPWEEGLQRPLEFELQLQLLAGEAYLVVDQLRDYRRSQYRGPRGEFLELAAEAVIELQWQY